jgi:hypothetical protein
MSLRAMALGMRIVIGTSVDGLRYGLGARPMPEPAPAEPVPSRVLGYQLVTAAFPLELFIAREIVRAHDGTIDVASASGRTTFTMRLPRYAGSTITERRRNPTAVGLRRRFTIDVCQPKGAT